MSHAFKNNTIQADAGDNTNKIKIKTQYNHVKNAVANSCAKTNNFTITRSWYLDFHFHYALGGAIYNIPEKHNLWRIMLNRKSACPNCRQGYIIGTFGCTYCGTSGLNTSLFAYN